MVIIQSHWVYLCLVVIPVVLAQQEDIEDRLLHKKKRRPYAQQGPPCGFYRDNGALAESPDDSRSLAAVLGGAAVGFKLGQKFPKYGSHGQGPIINNIVTSSGSGGYPGFGGYGGGSPCGQAPYFPQGGPVGGLIGSHLGGLGDFPRNGGVNWDRTIRQFNRHVVRPISRWF